MLKQNSTRIRFLYFCFLLVACFVLYRLFSLQIVDYGYFTAKIKSQSEAKEIVQGKRGEIFMSDKGGNLVALAKDKDQPFVYAVPSEIKDPTSASNHLAGMLGLDEKTLSDKLAKKADPYEIIKKLLSTDEVGAIQKLKEPGIYLDKEYGRLYPNGELASQLVGFTSLRDNKLVGQYGLEEYYNDLLLGAPGEEIVSKDVFGNWVSVVEKQIQKETQNGENLVLTIDPNIQAKAEEELATLVQSKSATGGTVIIMNPHTGAVLAMASTPSFDPNDYRSVKDLGVFLNPATQLTYEPGSTFKPITFSIALEEHVITPDTTYIDYGKVQVDDRVIKNFHNEVYGKSTMTNVLESSINTGAVFVVQKLDKQIFYDYLKKFGFDQKTGVGVSEVGGNISNLKSMRNINYATASFGQGISVTPLGLLSAISSIANGGVIQKPYLVEKVMKEDGTSDEPARQDGVRMFSEVTARTLTQMMVSVVENGFGKKAKVDHYSIAGKTGTAQIPDLKNGGYYANDVIHNFVGFAPASDPKFSILLKIDRPKGEDPSSSTVAKAFHNLAQFLFDYYEIPPDQP